MTRAIVTPKSRGEAGGESGAWPARTAPTGPARPTGPASASPARPAGLALLADLLAGLALQTGPGLATGSGGEVAMSGPLGRLAMPRDATQDFAQAGTEILVALRPEKIRLSAKRHGEGHAVRGTVHTSAYLGERSHFHVSVEGLAQPIAVAAQNAEREIVTDHRSGTQVYLSWEPEALVLLPR